MKTPKRIGQSVCRCVPAVRRGRAGGGLGAPVEGLGLGVRLTDLGPIPGQRCVEWIRCGPPKVESAPPSVPIAAGSAEPPGPVLATAQSCRAPRRSAFARGPISSPGGTFSGWGEPAGSRRSQGGSAALRPSACPVSRLATRRGAPETGVTPGTGVTRETECAPISAIARPPTSRIGTLCSALVGEDPSLPGSGPSQRPPASVGRTGAAGVGPREGRAGSCCGDGVGARLRGGSCLRPLSGRAGRGPLAIEPPVHRRGHGRLV